MGACRATHHPTRTATDAIQPVDEQTAERQAANAAIECINCAVCYGCGFSSQQSKLSGAGSTEPGMVAGE